MARNGAPTVKNVDAILNTAKTMGIPAKLVDLAEVEEVQQSQCAFGTFCIIYNGKILIYHRCCCNNCS